MAWRLADRRRIETFGGASVVITGGARGLGLALARAFGREGAHVFLLARTAAELERAKDDLASRGVRADIMVCDVRDESAANAAIASVLERTGRIDVLVNNAGVIQMTPFEHAQHDDFDDSLRIHFWAPLTLIRACLPTMRRQHRGRIINISSVGGRVAVPHLLPYCVGKFALSALSDGLHAELAKDGIAVTTVTPGLMRTGSHRNVVIRGKHRGEAAWFGAAAATPLTSMRADRAARMIVEASRRRRARVSPGWQSRALQRAAVLMPEVTQGLMTATAAWLLPGPDGAAGEQPRLSRSLDLGWLAAVLPTRAAVDLNQPIAPDELGVRSAHGVRS
jgi:short-subunit dehydrogenase